MSLKPEVLAELDESAMATCAKERVEMIGKMMEKKHKRCSKKFSEEDKAELMIAVVERIEDQKDMQKGTYVEEVVYSGKVPHMQAVEGALQHAKKTYAQSASTA